MNKQTGQPTHAELILRAAAEIAHEQGSGAIITRRDIRDKIGISHSEWMAGFTAIFQAMRSDHPGGAPYIGERYRNVFRRINRGNYALTAHGESLVAAIPSGTSVNPEAFRRSNGS